MHMPVLRKSQNMRLSKLITLGLGVALLLTQATARGEENQKAKQITITSSAFKEGSAIPKEYTGDGKDISPPLSWSDVPEQTKSLALTCEDPDAPRGTWFHWIIFNIPPSTRKLKEDIKKTATLPDGSLQGNNDFDKPGYNGPAPPPGAVHHYLFKLLALDTKLDITPGCTKSEYHKATNGHILAAGQFTGTYTR